MKMVQKLSILAMVITLASCNEKVSPELQQGNATTPDTDGGPTIVPNEYFIKVTNTAPLILNYKLHKTGAGNKNTACEVRSTTELNNDNFRANPTANDITCYLEAEELSLRAGGLSLKIESSPNTCEFVSYAPYSYYKQMPGSSSGSYTAVICTTDATNQTHIDRLNPPTVPPAPNTYSSTAFLTYDTGAGVYANTSCDTVISESTPLAGNGTTVPRIRQPFPLPESDQDLCKYDYTLSGGPNCDEGIISIREYQVTFDADKADQSATAAKEAVVTALTADYGDLVDNDGPGGPDDGTEVVTAIENAAIVTQGNTAYATAYAAWSPTAKSVYRTHYCGGSAYNCISGPIKTHTELTGPRGSFVSTTEYDKPFEYEYKYENLFPNKPSYVYANYRRDLANSNIAYGTSEKPHNATYTGAWASAAFGKIFEPNLMERYSRNLNYNQSSMIDTGIDYTDGLNTIFEGYLSQSNRYNAMPLAAEPYVGVSYNYYTNPYYTFYCLDHAYDIKARIRMVVRDWDRIFPTDASQELLSDINLGSNARQDLQFYVEDPDSEDEYNDFNDLLDWDDRISMERYISSGVLIYRPLPTAEYPEGYFNPDRFPGY